MKEPKKISDSMFAIGPLDGRYKEKVSDLSLIFSEFGLMKCRFAVEAKILLALGKAKILPRKISAKEIAHLNGLVEKFGDKDFDELKAMEKITNHDVKAVEYFLKEKMKGSSAKDLIEYVHLGRTSEDINNLAYAFMLRDGIFVLKAQYEKVKGELESLAAKNRKTSMLALTHGQPASPTTFGWEMNVFRARLSYGIEQLNSFKLKVKLNGATAGDSALYSAYPNVNWRKFSDEFVASLSRDKKNLQFVNNPFTTQIESHDTYRELFDIIRGMNLVLMDFSRDMWSYISRGVIVQIPKSGEIGSSAMPQKVNPIDFENAEGNLDLANALCEFFGRKLTISRLQRDLSDSTVERNFGLVFGHTKIALLSLEKGLSRIKVDVEAMEKELDNHWEVVSEAYQVVLRSEGVADGYEMLKEFTRGKVVDKGTMQAFIEEVAKKHKLSKSVLDKMKKITPGNYIGNRNF